MTLGWIGLLLPVLELGAVARLVSRVYVRRYRTLLAFLLVEAISHLTVALAWKWNVALWVSSQPVRMTVRFLVTLDVLHISCVRMSSAQRWKMAGLIALESFVCCAAFGAARLSPLQSFILFREFFHLLLAAGLTGACIHIWRNPICENRDHRYYREGITAAMILLAIAGTFVRNGFGYMLFPFSMTTWKIVDRCEYIAMMFVVAGMAWGMTSNISCYRPSVADRMRAANRLQARAASEGA